MLPRILDGFLDCAFAHVRKGGWLNMFAPFWRRRFSVSIAFKPSGSFVPSVIDRPKERHFRRPPHAKNADLDKKPRWGRELCLKSIRPPTYI
jgi:hypothetical protein